MLDIITSYFIHAKEELKKVSWPTRDDTLKKTILVIALSLVVAAYLGILDYLFSLLLQTVI